MSFSREEYGAEISEASQHPEERERERMYVIYCSLEILRNSGNDVPHSVQKIENLLYMYVT